MRMRRITGSKKRKAYVGEGEDGNGYHDGCEKKERKALKRRKVMVTKVKRRK
jgi:hypothetical protein